MLINPYPANAENMVSF